MRSGDRADELRRRARARRGWPPAGRTAEGWELGNGPRRAPAGLRALGGRLRLLPPRPPERARRARAGTASTSSIRPRRRDPGGPAARLAQRPDRVRGAPAELLAEAGHEVIVPSLPGFAWSDDPGGAAERRRRWRRACGSCSDEGLGLDRYAARRRGLGRDHRRAHGLRRARARRRASTSAPRACCRRRRNLEDPPMSEDEIAYAQRARSWLRREGHHILIQSVGARRDLGRRSPTRPPGLAAYLLEKYRRWSRQRAATLERRFSHGRALRLPDDVLGRTTRSAPSMRLYWAERRDRWRLEPGETIDVPVGDLASSRAQRGRSGAVGGQHAGDAEPAARVVRARPLATCAAGTRCPRAATSAPSRSRRPTSEDLLAFLDDARAASLPLARL